MTRTKVKRIVPKRTRERAFFAAGEVVAGVDEVGRGSWAGPVVAAAVVLEPQYRIRRAYDSKLMSAVERASAAERIAQRSRCYGVGVVEVAEINRYGLSWAVAQSGLRALAQLAIRPTKVLLDGNWNYLRTHYECETIVGGDCYELCIAAASIVAKVHRDALMQELDRRYPGYAFASNKGYGTAAHRKALAEAGVCDVHRTQWNPVARRLQETLPFD